MDWVPVDSPAWYGGRGMFLGSAKWYWGGSLLCDRELAVEVPHLAGPLWSPGCPQVPRGWEQPCAGLCGGEAVLSPLAEGLSEQRGACLWDSD